MTPDEARADLMTLYRRGSGYANKPDISTITFCSCCGSQYLTKDGKVQTNLGWVEVAKGPQAAEDFYSNLYGRKWRERYTTQEAEQFTAKFSRRNAPGVTLAFMESEKALDILYTGEHRKLAGGYEINDPEMGVHSVLWVNE